MTIAKHSTVTNRIEGATDGTEIGNVGDRLKVTSTLSGIPAADVIHIPEYLTNGGSPDMDVNGSSTPVEFTWSPGSGETWYLSTLSALLIDGGTMDATDFGSQSGGLSNGVLIEIKSKGVTYTFANLQNNMDLGLKLGGGGSGGSTSALLGLGSTSGFYDTQDVFQASTPFLPEIVLQNSTSDFVKVTVRDNLSGVDEFRMIIGKWRAV